MFVSRLQLVNFRNYQNQLVSFSPGKVLIYGANGQGKTNLLEAIYYLVIGKSFRGKDSSLIRFGAESFFLGAKITKDGQKITLGIEYSGKGKIFTKNGQKQKGFSYLLGSLKGVLFTPDEPVNFFGSPTNRRKSLDLFLAQTSKTYLLNLIYYNKVLANKNALLKQPGTTENIIDAWDYKLAEYGAEIIKEREKSLRVLNELLTELNDELKFLLGKITIDYKPQGTLEKESFYRFLKQRQGEERIKKFALFGPHRDDFRFYLNDKDLKVFGSQGQKKGVLLLFKLAQAVYMTKILGEKPVLLLDDLYSEFDSEKRRALEGFFLNFSEQVLITATDPGDLKNYDQAVLINDGLVL
ncbi:DNA recombination protein RecF [Carboxydothermus pertinax]|uniref:DNA replication and repair protein RecF n=1 Tax=Carboxydothermus pertinax TaxID=870242 RepID=A0A1L8CTE1_9THEO|nr:DNA recombination protein RecF [Carboxydothermus pertinax]